jgi:hypothetical protein
LEHKRLIPLSKNCVVKSYLFNSIWHEFNAIEFGVSTFNKIESPIFKFLWKNIRKLDKNTLQHDKINGGINLPNLKSKQLANFITRFKELTPNPKNPWQALYIYWFGLLLTNKNDIYRNNKLSKVLKPPKTFSKIILAFKKFRLDKELWEIDKKEDTYNHIRNKILTKHRIERKIPYLQWTNIWKN